MTSPLYADLADMAEDDRIAVIGKCAEEGKRVAFIVDDEEKAERYLRKLLAGFKVSVLYRGPGPVNDSIQVHLGPRSH